MTKWVLLTYILGCAGPDCEVPTYNETEYRTEAECFAGLEEWQERGEGYVGVCIKRSSNER